MTITYLLGMSNIELFLATKMPSFTCNFSHICKHQSTYIWCIMSMYKYFNTWLKLVCKVLGHDSYTK